LKTLYASNDPVELGWLMSVLEDAGFEPVMLDQHMSVAEGSIGAIQRRLAVAESDFEAAERLVRSALASV
jgi:hypothetical protein